MISAWTVYWVMQLDSVNGFFGIVGFLACIAGFIALLVGHTNFSIPIMKDDKEQGVSLMQLGKKFIAVGIACLAFVAFLPSSKTAAAMILVPALTSEQVMEPVGAEAKELYDLAKQALRNVATKPADEPKPETKE